MKKMYSNIGDKVCKAAKICGFIGIIAAVVGLVCLFVAIANSEDVLFIVGPALAVLGVACLIGSWPLYAFGQITNDVHAMRTNAPAKTSAKQFSDLPEL